MSAPAPHTPDAPAAAPVQRAPEAVPRTRPAPLLLLSALLALGTLAAVLMVQLRQHALLNRVIAYEQDYAVIALNQLEIEFLRLREVVALHERGATGLPPRQDLQLRYDVFVSRIGLFEGRHSRALLDAQPGSGELLRQLEAFVLRADELLPAALAGRDAGQALRELLEQLHALDRPIHDLMVEATLRAAQHVSARTDQVRQYQRSTLLLGAVLTILMLLSAALALHQMRVLQRAHQRQLDLSAELRQARIEAEAASEAKSVLLADVSHELRTPLHGLLGMLALLRRAPPEATPPNEHQSWLATADASAQHLMRLLDDLLDLSRLEAGSLTLARGSIDLRQLMAEVVRLMQPQAQARSLQLDWQVDATLPTWLVGDATRLRQILYNLVSNALKFSERGRVMIEARRLPGSGAAPDALLLAVRDPGMGIDAAALPQLFRRYSRASQAQRAGIGGHGLGLAISRDLARLMGGELDAVSTPGEGSVFRLRLPLQPARTPADDVGIAPVLPDAAMAQAVAAMTTTTTTTTTAPADRPPTARRPDSAGTLRVLVADDHPVNGLYLQALLDHLGHGCTLAENGRIALDIQRDDPHDLILMDVHMPVMDGIAAMRAIRGLPGTAARVPMLALTADVFPQTRSRCLEAGADEVLTKPLVLEALQAALDRHAQARADVPPPRDAALWPDPRPNEAGGRTATPPAPGPALDEVRGPAAAPDRTPPPALLDEQACQRLRNLLGPNDARGLYGGFFDQAEDAARRIDQACRDHDVQGLRRVAHSVKGAALNLGLPALGACAERLSREDLQLPAGRERQQAHEFARLLRASREHCLLRDLLP